MKNISKFLFLAVIASTLFVGCTTRITDFTVLSTKNNNIKPKTPGKRIKGESSAWMILIIPTGTPDVKTAIDKAIEEAGPGYDALVDGVLSSYGWTAVLVGKMGYIVEGTPIKSTDLALLEAEGKIDMNNVTFHSKLGKNNDKAYQRILDNIVKH